MRTTLSLFIALFIFTSCTYQVNPISGNKRAYAYTWQDEIKLGKEADKEIVQQYGLYDDASLAQYIEELGQDILEESHLKREGAASEFKNTAFTFRLLDSPVVNAFALPGGYIYITRGLLTHLNNEAQLAVVLGHEIGHVAGRHHSKRALQQKAGQVALMGGAVIGETLLGVPGQDLAKLGGQASAMLFLSYSRDDESESDRVGVEYAALNGYKTDEAAEFFNSLKRISEQYGKIPTHQSSHPDPGDREKKMKSLYQDWKQKGLELNKISQGDFKERINGILVGENPRNGFVEAGVFYHPELKFMFKIPNDWSLINEPTRVILVDKEQQGVLVITTTDVSTSPKVVVEKFLAQEGITKIDSKAEQINGLEAAQGTGTASTQNGNVGLFISSVKLDGVVYQLLGYSTAAQFDAYKPYFLEPYTRFNRLTNAEKLNIQPTKLKLVKVENEAIFTDLLPKPLPVGTKELDWAIINQVELSDRIKEGTVLKLY